MMLQPAKKREPLMDQAYFDGEVEYQIGSIDSSEDALKEPAQGSAEDEAVFVYSIFRKRYELLILRYSRGEDIAEIAQGFPAVIAAWQRYLKMEGRQSGSLNEDINDYVCALWLVSFAIIFAAKPDVFERLLRCIGAPGQDALLDRLVATRIPNWPIGAGLAFPKPYEALFQAIDASPDERSTLIKKFLKAWYPAMGSLDAYWHNCHKGPEGGGFFGYWCIEAAGVVAAFKIDDSGFRDAPYYPKDLASFGA
jgi:hypothetical protein